MWQRSKQQHPGVIGGRRLDTPENEPTTRRVRKSLKHVHLRLLRSTSVIIQLEITMSTKAKATLAGTVLGTIGIVYFVHYQQVADKAVRQYATIS
jgi:hypothetical protein